MISINSVQKNALSESHGHMIVYVLEIQYLNSPNLNVNETCDSAAVPYHIALETIINKHIATTTPTL